MIDNKILLENLDWLEKQYQVCSKNKGQHFSREIILYPRYAVLEVCGWLEMTVDDMLCDIYKKKIGENISNGKRTLYIDSVWGLSNESFEKIFSNIVGYINLKKLQDGEIKGDYDFLISFVGDIFKKRNEFAHTYLNNENEAIYKSPKKLREDIERVGEILNKMEEKLSI
jgi:hypothetical protein